jgi:ribosome biogenesis SPOUT family RNA methylase Rps3
MDMRAETKLSPGDAKQFEFVVFGGILGDHPPQDRAKEFRESFKQIRQLGDVQMTTDTALLVSKEILEDQRPFDSLKFTDEPAIPMDKTLFRFLDEAMPLAALEKSSPNNSELNAAKKVFIEHHQN